MTDSNIQRTGRKNEQGQELVWVKFITVTIRQHADFGGGLIEADLPDTHYHRHYYPVPVRQWRELRTVK